MFCLNLHCLPLVLFVLMLYIVLASKYIQTRQETLLADYEKLNQELALLRITSKSNKGQTLAHWYAYLRLQRTTVHICRTIRDYSHYCVFLLSALIPFYISVQCYLVYIVIFQDIPLHQKQFFMIDVGEMNLCLFVLVRECAKVVSLNQAIEVQNRKFYTKFSQLGIIVVSRDRKLARRAHARRLMQIQMMQSYRRLHSYAFRVVGNYRITSKSYNLVIFYIFKIVQ